MDGWDGGDLIKEGEEEPSWQSTVLADGPP